MNRFMHLIFLLLAFGLAFAQPDNYDVTLILPDGTESDFVVKQREDGTPVVSYSFDDYFGHWGELELQFGGAVVDVPVEQVVRADLVSPGTQTVWQFVLKDGRVLDGAIGQDATLYVEGRNEFGGQTFYQANAQDPDRQPFIGIIFDATAAGQAGGSSSQAVSRADADTVNLRNGDVLSGEILTADFAVQASYGTLSFTKDQLASISIESQDGRTDQVVLDVGDQVSGVLQNESIEITLTSGATVTLEKGNIGSITFATE